MERRMIPPICSLWLIISCGILSVESGTMYWYRGKTVFAINKCNRQNMNKSKRRQSAVNLNTNTLCYPSIVATEPGLKIINLMQKDCQRQDIVQKWVIPGVLKHDVPLGGKSPCEGISSVHSGGWGSEAVQDWFQVCYMGSFLWWREPGVASDASALMPSKLLEENPK